MKVIAKFTKSTDCSGKKKFKFFSGIFRKRFMRTMVEMKKVHGKECLEIDKQLELKPVEPTHSKLCESELPNFTPISTPDKRLINKSRFNMMFLLKPCDKKMAKAHFASIMREQDLKERERLKQFWEKLQQKEYEQKKKEIENKYTKPDQKKFALALMEMEKQKEAEKKAKEGDKYQYQYKDFIHFYESRITFRTVGEYTKNSFFHMLLNKGVRAFSKRGLDELAYTRLPFNDVYLSLKELYHQQYLNIFRQKPVLTCYRGCQMADDEIQFFSANKGKYVQMEGFLSTSLSKGADQMFINNTLLEISIDENERKYEDHGFADISADSIYQDEK